MLAQTWWLILYLTGAIAMNGGSLRKDAELLVPELIVKYGYKGEDHSVITEDGYVLKMFRILPKRQTIAKKKPVLLVHALLASSADYSGVPTVRQRLRRLVGELRGSHYSKHHLKLPVESKEYWDFSWHEMGYYDLPAMIDHMLSVTNSKKLFYIGHSQGVTLYFIMTATRPECNEKVALMTALSPAVFWKHVRSPILKMIKPLVRPGTDTIRNILNALKIFEFLPYNEAGLRIVQPLCRPEVRHNVCIQMLGVLAGPHPDGTDPDAEELPSMLPRVIAAIPVADRKFNHVDFVLAKNVREVLYAKILTMLDKFDQ
ncbi:lysosomal acid lipase [Culex quinquefasciatus]|uniref:Lysosomal acid lipase n=1 Tax=Culex quinquefasciatus TaxID=7176 RepID=B0W6H0_CULQU|nr:lysosomal acid lipase [Culex quinquefasciatus]|eukprot:XP_001844304.1 lysosomal acid lipase [Culex quinquefasciatus]